ncbi:PREDICTED: receptor homology region, transmembrane domain- and RING domain-containing protein 2-like isoform X2 [Lupinus angustifolius]|uniref:receptor homology region, transmembrane domain- and RING domain-containing protein 2-like isoform X2 n=1 Tax=Lupinus angustifolius TaxID=3871 RepID=UPI00092F28ED|nr:PREDICTED: receptor homology region, transmembrane domain- and RING domain-containing protein 2-like isoform X2 [Lupinus angustifolius]
MGIFNLLLFFFYLLGLCAMAASEVVLIGDNVTLSFNDIEANFAPTVKGSGECGVLYLAEPLDACTELTNKVDHLSNVSSPFVLVVRGGCSFEEKVRSAQRAGYKAAIVYDNEDSDVLVAMAGNSAGIRIHAVFVSTTSGEILKKYAGSTNMELWLIETFENSAWSIMAISFISLLAMSAVLATCFFVRRHHIRRERPRASHVRDFHGMSSHLVKAMPSLIFNAVLEDNYCTSRTCAICLEDYCVGEKLRVLPCCHKFHAVCVDSWLTSWRTFCPVCKRDARTGLTDPPPSESTPLLSTSFASVASSILSSGRSSLASSSAIQIARAPSQSPSVSRNHSLASMSSPSLSISRSSVDLRNGSQRSQASHLNLPCSTGYPSLSSLNSRYMSPYIPSPSNASVSYMGSSSHQQHPLRYSESAATFSPFASANSLPEV